MKTISIITAAVLVLLTLSFLGVQSAATQASSASGQSGLIPNIGTYHCSATQPCPMGVVDYGVNGNSHYSYTSIEFKSWANFTTLNIGLATKGLPNHHMTVQQNTVDYKVYENGIPGEYWTQDVPTIAQSSGSFKIGAEDNIWNFSSPSARMGGTIFGNLNSDCSLHGGQPTFYFCVAKQSFTTTLPFEIQMVVLTGKVTSGPHAGNSAVEFEFAVYHSGSLLGSHAYDLVAFNGKAAAFPKFLVGGNNPLGLNNDYETVLCGPGGGSSVHIISISAKISEFYAPTKFGSYKVIPHAWSAGSDTAETVSGVHVTGSGQTGVASGGADNNNQIF